MKLVQIKIGRLQADGDDDDDDDDDDEMKIASQTSEVHYVTI